MKKILLITLFFFSTNVFSQLSELSKAAKYMKDSEETFYKDIYKNIRQSAIDMWDDNHVMIVSTINQNADALTQLLNKLSKMSESEQKIFANAIKAWVDKSDEYKFKEKGQIDFKSIFTCCKINWLMVKSQYDQQTAAANAY